MENNKIEDIIRIIWSTSVEKMMLTVFLLRLPPLVLRPPPLVRRCNSTTARLGYRKVGLEWPYNTPPGQWICDSTIKLEDVDGLNDSLPRISWLPFRYSSARASDVWGTGSGPSCMEEGQTFLLLTVTLKYSTSSSTHKPVTEIIDKVFAKTSPKRSFSMTEYERFGHVFTKTRVYKFGHQCVMWSI